ncbi:mucin-2 [Streptomyces sp. NA02536]|uniref:mucin-2 n=1 Tax=Streptomyces sp. NA02536 TaxID=2742133 RepID=UPI00159203A8|nr:mucin-2 [Streptomyces sp. NA02536]QKW01928.1 mucin-2 [Streptomyces sp. NA02536]
MGDNSKRMANPEDLEHLAKLLDGRGKLQDRLDEAFTRASRLGVRDKLSPLTPMTSWTRETATDLRRRSAILRAEKGDPLAAALFAGFKLEELKGVNLPPDVMLIANASVANPEAFDTAWLERQKGETLQDWIQRIQADAVAKVTNNENLGEVVGDYIELTAMVSTVPGAFQMTATGTLHLIQYFKSLKSPRNIKWLKAPGTTLAQILRGEGSSLIPARIRALGAQIGARTPAPILDALAGKNSLAAYSGKVYAWEANLLKVGRAASGMSRATGASRLSAFASGAGSAFRTAGWWRAAGIGGSAVSTVIGAVDVIQEGDPVDAFKRDKAGYVAKVSGVAFNASLTAAMVAPTPLTIGAAAVTGAVYGVSSIIANKEKIREFPGKVADAGRWAGKKVGEGAGKLADGAKSAGKFIGGLFD